MSEINDQPVIAEENNCEPTQFVSRTICCSPSEFSIEQYTTSAQAKQQKALRLEQAKQQKALRLEQAKQQKAQAKQQKTLLFEQATQQKALLLEQAIQQKAQAKQQKSLLLEQAKQQKLLLLAEESTPLSCGIGLCAVAAMGIFKKLQQSRPRMNQAFRQMIASRYIFPPSLNINKFATGGIAEESVHRLLCDIGIECSNVSTTATLIDLSILTHVEMDDIEHNVNLEVSVKNSGDINNAPVLENYRGNSRPNIRPLPSTFIIFTESKVNRARVIYLDEEILRKGYPTLSDAEFYEKIYKKSDSNLSFKSGFLAKFIPRLPAEYVVTADYPFDLEHRLQQRNLAELALDEVDRQLNAL